MSPIELFNDWYKEELKHSNVRIPSACCLSTIGLDGYPNARFVSLKEVTHDSFIVTGPLSSRKGLEIDHHNKVALTFWWAATERQIRIQGDATKIPDREAEAYFSERSFDSQLVSLLSEQGNKIDNLESLHRKYEEAEPIFSNKQIARPANWGGFSIKPIRIELMEFKASRFHERRLYELKDGGWVACQLQP